MGDQQTRRISIRSNSKNNKCLECKKSFSDFSNLRKHVKKLHPNKINELAPLVYKESSNFKFTCENCGKNFNHEPNLRYHMKTHEDIRIDQYREIENNIKASKNCPMCSYYSSSKKEMLNHFKDVHEITIQSKDIDFSSVEDFQQWKINMENDSNSKFVNKGTHRFITYYICHRSGSYVPSGIGKRRLKTQGTIKMNAYCPASINLIKDIDGKCKVNLIETHVGHQTDIEHLYLTSAERQNLALQIASKDKGKISRKLKGIRSRHKNMQDLDPSLIIQVEHGWKVFSKSNHEMYFLQEIKENCTCHLICMDCEICIHRYCCSCLDSSIKFNMCKHIHLLAKFRKNDEPPNEEQSPSVVGAETEDDDNNLYIYYDQTVDESETIVTQLSKKKFEISLEEEKDIIKTCLLKHLDNIKSPTQLAIFKNVIAPLIPTLAATENIKQEIFPSS